MKILNYIKITYMLLIVLFISIGMTSNFYENLNPNINPSFWIIFNHNFMIITTTIILSFFTFGIYSLIFIFNQFFFLGVTIKTIIISHSVKEAIIYLLPHGIFEIPAMILAGWIPIMFIFILIELFWFKKNLIKIKKYFLFILKNILIMYTLLILAALTEKFITPLIINIFS